MKPKEKPHYVNNAEFSAAIVEYVARCNVEAENGNAKPLRVKWSWRIRNRIYDFIPQSM